MGTQDRVVQQAPRDVVGPWVWHQADSWDQGLAGYSLKDLGAFPAGQREVLEHRWEALVA